MKCKHSLLLDDLELYQESHKILKEVNKIIVFANCNTRICYGEAKYAKVVNEKEKSVKNEE